MKSATALLCIILLQIPYGASSKKVQAEEVQTSPSTPKNEPASAKQKPFELVVDYLPAALYEGESLTVCLRVENTTAKEAVIEVLSEAQDRNQKPGEASSQKVQAKAGGFGSYQKDHDIRGKRAVRFTLKTPAGDLSGPVVRLLQDQDAWPVSVVREGRLTDKESGEVLIPVARRVNKDERRAYAPVQWAMGTREQQEGGPIKQAALFLPGGWGAARPATGESKVAGGANLEFEVLEMKKSPPLFILGPYVPEGVPPILCAIGDALNALPKPAPDGVVIVLPPEDLDVATDPRVYRIALESFLPRLKLLGVRQTVLLPPLRFGVAEKRRTLLLTEIREAAQVYGARLADWDEELDEQRWRLDPDTPGVYGRRPNTAGLKKIGQKLDGMLP